MKLFFTKMHGLGNDFIVIDDMAEELDLSAEAVQWLCDRNFGIGADGLMLVRPATVSEADFAWWFRNSDGSVAEMCGNGIRCFAKYVADRGLLPTGTESVRVETLVGVLGVRLFRGSDGVVESATVDMGEPILEPTRVPTTLHGVGESDAAISQLLDTEMGEYEVTAVSMGNPHCVVFVDDVEDAPVHTLGPVIETHPAFPKKTNVEFVEVTDRATIKVRVWERGVGETLACGTGACAAVVATSLSGRGGREMTVELPGGELEISWAKDGRVLMTGSATEVFTGTLPVTEEDD